MHEVVDILRGDYLQTRRENKLVAGPCSFLALSLGGMIAVAWAARYPREFQTAVLVNTSLPGINRFYYRLRLRVLLSNLGSFVRTRDGAQREQRLLSLVSNYAKVRERLLPSWVAIQKERPVSSSNYLRMLISALTFTPPRLSPFVHTLILKSRGDRLIDSRCSDQIQKTWQVAMREHETAGHDLTSDDPQWVVDRITEWRRG